MRVHNPFALDYDYKIESMMDEYLIEATQIMLEALPDTRSDSQWYVKWKADSSMTLKSSFNRFKEYATKQDKKYKKWLDDNAGYFNTERYKPGKESEIEDAPNYKAAVSRIKRTFTAGFNMAIGRIDLDEGNNKWYMRTLIGDYNGNGKDFVEFCEKYYYGEDKVKTLTPQDMIEYIPYMYDYCYNFGNMVGTLEKQLQSLLTYINQDPYTGNYEPTNMAERELKSMKNDALVNGKASTNPQNNVVKESYLSIFIEAINQVENTKESMISKVHNNGEQKTNVNNTEEKTDPQQGQQNRPTDRKQEVLRKKKIAGELIQRCFKAKVNAAGKIYRDFIVTLETVYYVYKNEGKK